MILVVIVLVALTGASIRHRRHEAQRFCSTFGIPKDWTDDNVVERYVIRARTVRVCALALGLLAGWFVARWIPVSRPALAVFCSEPNQALASGESSGDPLREVEGIRAVRENPSFVRGRALTTGGFEFTCAPPLTPGPQFIATAEKRKRERSIPTAVLVGFSMYAFAVWRTERRALRLVPSGSTPRNSAPGLAASTRVRPVRLRRSFDPLLALGPFAVLAAIAFRAPQDGVARLALAVGAAAFVVVAITSSVRMFRRPIPTMRHKSLRAAALERRRLRDYLPPWLVWVGFACVAWLVGLFVLSVVTTDLGDPLLWPSWRYEPAVLLTLICALMTMGIGAAVAVVRAPQPFGRDDTKAAIVDDARRVGAVQRLTVATITAGVIASSPVARLLLSSNGQPFGSVGVPLLLAFWIAVPGTTDVLHHRWVALIGRPQTSMT